MNMKALKVIAVLIVTAVVIGSALLAQKAVQPQSPISLSQVRLDKTEKFAGTCPGGRTWFMEQDTQLPRNFVWPKTVTDKS